MSRERTPGLPWVWGATAQEHARAYPADDLVPGGLRMTRAVSVAAPASVTWRWLCQLAVAPYSYDWIDNRGRRSPRELTPGADALEIGQPMVMVFDLASVEHGRSWTGRTRPGAGEGLLGSIAVTYAAEPADPDSDSDSRLVCRMVASAESRPQRLRAAALAWGDLVMMRKQLLTLRDLAQGAGSSGPVG